MAAAAPAAAGQPPRGPRPARRAPCAGDTPRRRCAGFGCGLAPAAEPSARSRPARRSRPSSAHSARRVSRALLARAVPELLLPDGCRGRAKWQRNQARSLCGKGDSIPSSPVRRTAGAKGTRGGRFCVAPLCLCSVEDGRRRASLGGLNTTATAWNVFQWVSTVRPIESAFWGGRRPQAAPRPCSVKGAATALPRSPLERHDSRTRHRAALGLSAPSVVSHKKRKKNRERCRGAPRQRPPRCPRPRPEAGDGGGGGGRGSGGGGGGRRLWRTRWALAREQRQHGWHVPRT